MGVFKKYWVLAQFRAITDHQGEGRTHNSDRKDNAGFMNGGWLTVMFLIPKGEIYTVKSDGTNRTEFAPAAILGSPVGLALDWITQNLYYTNPSTQSVEVTKKIKTLFCFFLYWFHVEHPSHGAGLFVYVIRFWNWEERFNTGKL